MNIPRELLEQLRKGNVVLFCGAGISMSEGGLPSGRQLARELAQRARLGDVGGMTLPEVAQAYELEMGHQSLIAYITSRTDDPRYVPLCTHHLIATLPFKQIITTNWDNLLEEALRQAGRPFVKVVRDSGIAYADEEKALLIKLHGSIEQKDTIVITGDDYYDVFARLPETANLVRSYFATRTVLFLGFGLADQDFKRLYHEVVRHLGKHKRRAYAVQLDPAPLTVKYWQQKNVQVIAADATAFLETLREELGIAEPSPPPGPEQHPFHPMPATSTSGAIRVTTPVFWQAYLHSVSEAYRDWHIPDELRDLIDWQVDPVPIDDYLLLRPVRAPLPLLRVGGGPTSTDTRGQELSPVVDRGAGTAVLITGGSGAGKSTCLKYLCSRTAVNNLLALERDNDLSDLDVLEMPVYVTLRRYGPTRLMELISAQFHRYGLSVTDNQLDDALEQVPFLFLFDGLDEVNLRWRHEVMNELETFRQRHSRHRIIVTARAQPQPSAIEGFEIYEIEPLTDTAVVAFAQHYLGNGDEFTRQIRQRALTDLVRVPLLLTLALIVFKRRSVAFDSLAGIYQEVVHLYEIAWEEHKRAYRLTHPLPWDILEQTLSDLAYKMVSDGARYAISRQETLEILAASVQRFSTSFRWPGGSTVDDLLTQLLVHSFLELVDDEVSFWHASFRDYFAALAVLRLPEEQIVKRAEGREWASITAFVGGLLENPRPVRDALVRRALDDIDDSGWPVYTLGLMGSDTTNDIIRACSRPTDIRTLQLAERVLTDRGFEGVGIFHDTWEMLEYPPIEEPDWDLIGIEQVSQMYESVMLALSADALTWALQRHNELYRYLDSFNPKPQDVIEPWLSLDGISDLDDFCHKLRAGQLSQAALLAFCRNTTSRASLPYLEEIILTTEDPRLRCEAQLAAQSVKRSWQ